MTVSSTNLTFFLPIMFLVVVEMTRIAREIDLRKVAIQEHRPLLVSTIFDFPRFLLISIIKIAFNTTSAFVNFTYNTINDPVRLVTFLTELISNIINGVVGDEKEQSDEPNKNIAKNIQHHLDETYETIESKIQSGETRAVSSISRFEHFFAPPLGRFSLLHFLNYLILAYLFVLAALNLNSKVQTISLSLIFLIWICIPILEVEEYDDLLRENKNITSLGNHMGFTVLHVALLYSYIIEEIRFDDIDFSLFGQNIVLPISAEIVLIFSGLFAIWLFLRTLYTEIKGTDPREANAK